MELRNIKNNKIYRVYAFFNIEVLHVKFKLARYKFVEEV